MEAIEVRPTKTGKEQVTVAVTDGDGLALEVSVTVGVTVRVAVGDAIGLFVQVGLMEGV